MADRTKQRPPTRTFALERPRLVSWPLLLPIAFAAVALAHWTLLRLPYFWDEGGYYVPAALDFYRSGTLIPVFTNAHPPLPNVVLGSLWHIFGFHILVTRLTACAFAAGALVAVFALGRQLLGSPWAGFVLALLTLVYPIWFTQSSLAHADIFAAAFTLAALALYLASPHLIGKRPENMSSNQRLGWTCALFCLSVLAKETAIVQPAALVCAEIFAVYRLRGDRAAQRPHVRWVLALLLPFPVLAAWYGFHYLRTGFVFGNPAFLRYNATANFTFAHLAYALRIRFVHLFWQRNVWLPLLLACACLLLPVRRPALGSRGFFGLPRTIVDRVALLLAANLVAFSILGGALLTRYLLPMYPLLLLLCLAVWRSRTRLWLLFAGLTASAFVSALWLNPFTFFAPEDNLTYRDMIVVQQQAIDYLNQHYPDATVLTAWPVSADLFRPELGYTTRRFQVFQIENFTAPELARAAQQPGQFDTALLFTTHYASPAFRRFLLDHADSWRGRRYSANLDLPPAQIARMLGGTIVWQTDHNGEWAAVVRFHRTYDARLTVPTPISSCLRYTQASASGP